MSSFGLTLKGIVTGEAELLPHRQSVSFTRPKKRSNPWPVSVTTARSSGSGVQCPQSRLRSATSRSAGRLHSPWGVLSTRRGCREPQSPPSRVRKRWRRAPAAAQLTRIDRESKEPCHSQPQGLRSLEGSQCGGPSIRGGGGAPSPKIVTVVPVASAPPVGVTAEKFVGWVVRKVDAVQSDSQRNYSAIGFAAPWRWADDLCRHQFKGRCNSVHLRAKPATGECRMRCEGVKAYAENRNTRSTRIDSTGGEEPRSTPTVKDLRAVRRCCSRE
eukprot:4048246-Prymnesium_polylepis.2